MINYKKLRSLSQENLRNNGSFAVIIFIFAGILIAALSLLDLVFSDLIIFLVLIPLLVLPIIFSFHFVILHKSEVDKFSLGIFFQGFRIYFSEHFNSSFSFWKTLGIGLLIYIGTTILSLLTINLPMYNANVFNFKTIIDQFVDIIYSNMSVEVLNNFVNDNWQALNLIALFVNALPLTVCAFYTVYSFSRNSVSIFLRDDMGKYQGKYLKVFNDNFIKQNRLRFFKADLYLNWPYYLGFICFYALGGYLGSLYDCSAVCTFTFALFISLFIYIAVFGSLRYANKEAIYQYFKEDYKKFDMDFQQKLLEDFTSRYINLTPTNSEDEDTKKDSDES